MSYVNEIKKGNATYDVQDKRIDDFPTNPSADGAYYLKNTISNGVSAKQWAGITNERRVIELNIQPALTDEQWEAKLAELLTNGELTLELPGLVPSGFRLGKDDVVLLTMFKYSHEVTLRVDNWAQDIDFIYANSRQTICSVELDGALWFVYATGVFIGTTLGVYIKLLSKNETGSRSLTKITRLIVDVRQGSTNFYRKFIMWFACDHFRLYVILNNGFARLNEQLGQDILNTHCTTEAELATNLQTLSLIEPPGASVPLQNMLVWQMINVLARIDECFKVTAPFLAEDASELNSIDLIRTESGNGGDSDMIYYDSSDRAWASYGMNAIYGQTNVTYSVSIDEM